MTKLISAVLLILPIAFVPRATVPCESKLPEAPSKFACDVTLHVVLHELGHALVREFDLPILGNEETLADAFATHFVIHHLPKRAKDVVFARVRSLMVEAAEVPRKEWTVEGEHNNDARRAHQIVSLAIAADAEVYTPLAKEIGMTENAIDNAKDYGTEIHRSWRRTLRPLMMPEGSQSKEARLACDPDSVMGSTINEGPLGRDIQKSLKSFDWHSQVKVFFSQGDGSAGWNRSRRTVTVKDGYVERFVKQGKKLASESKR